MPLSDAPLTARVEAERAIADVLAEHLPVFQADGDYCERQWVECSCDSEYFVDTDAGYSEHRAHVASLLADLMAERQAEAWDDAKDKTAQAYQHGGRYGAPRNPYRPDPKDTRDE